MLRLYLCKGFNNLLEQDDKGDVSAETTGPTPAEVSAGIQISAECLLCYCLSLSPNNYLSCLYLILLGEESVTFL
ncbi:hypothetical protein V6N13_003331 [Hibiscus sabdariffa]